MFSLQFYGNSLDSDVTDKKSPERLPVLQIIKNFITKITTQWGGFASYYWNWYQEESKKIHNILKSSTIIVTFALRYVISKKCRSK